jgi:hypothetical protein
VADTALGHEDAQNLRDGYWFLSRYVAGDFTGGDALFREPALGRNLLALAADGASVMLRAHNAHCAKTGAVGTTPSLGAQFAQSAEGSRYVVVAQAYGGGSQRKLGQYGIGEDSVDHGTLGPILASVSTADAFLISAHSDQWPSSRSARGEYGNAYQPSVDFDLMVFLRTVSPSHAR